MENIEWLGSRYVLFIRKKEDIIQFTKQQVNYINIYNTMLNVRTSSVRTHTLLKASTNTHTLLKASKDIHILLKPSIDTHTLLKASTNTRTLLKASTDTHSLLKASTDTNTLLKEAHINTLLKASTVWFSE